MSEGTTTIDNATYAPICWSHAKAISGFSLLTIIPSCEMACESF